MAAPKVSIISPAAEAVLTSAQVTVTGKAIDTAIASVTVSGTAASVAADGTFSAPITLTPGVNTITAEATDGTGQKSHATEQVTYQPPAPVITRGVTPPPAKKCLVLLIKRGRTLSSARQKIIAAGCAVGKITTKKSPVAKGRVISANPKAGTSVPVATKIAISVSKGHPHTQKAHDHKH